MIKKNMIKKIVLVIVILLFLTTPLAYSNSTPDFTFPSVTKDVIITDDGLVHIKEDMLYSITGSTEGVYRQIPLNDGENIANISVETPRFYNEVEINNSTNEVTIVVNLYKDSQKTQIISDEDVEVIYSYTLNNSIKKYSSNTEFDFVSWDKDMQKGVKSLKTYIQVPDDFRLMDESLTSQDYLVSSGWTENNTLVYEFEDVPANVSIEQTIMIPESSFEDSNNLNIIGNDMDALIVNVLIVVFIILIVLPIVIYVNYGIEAKIDANTSKQRDISAKDSLIFVNNMLSKNTTKGDINAIRATFLDLINKKCILIKEVKESDIILAVDKEKYSKLEKYEQDVIDLLQINQNGDFISLTMFLQLKKDIIYDFLSKWYNHTKEYLNTDKIKEYFDNRAYRYIRTLTIISTIYALIFLFIFRVSLLSTFAIVLLVEYALFLRMYRRNSRGVLTEAGLKYNLKWNKFKKYLEEFQSNSDKAIPISKWNEIIPYATTIGSYSTVKHDIESQITLDNLAMYDKIEYPLLYFVLLPKIEFIPWELLKLEDIYVTLIEEGVLN